MDWVAVYVPSYLTYETKFPFEFTGLLVANHVLGLSFVLTICCVETGKNKSETRRRRAWEVPGRRKGKGEE